MNKDLDESDFIQEDGSMSQSSLSSYRNIESSGGLTTQRKTQLEDIQKSKRNSMPQAMQNHQNVNNGYLGGSSGSVNSSENSQAKVNN